VVAAFGRINGLLNIAGVIDTNNSVDTLTDALWNRVTSINLTAPVKLIRAVVPHMIKAGGGSIVNVTSEAGTSGAIAGVAYTASKHGIVGSLLLRYDTSS
jgi:NAD(P)-dependent dehydrogenase (short-subunit alcohol dehydrogenase family)